MLLAHLDERILHVVVSESAEQTFDRLHFLPTESLECSVEHEPNMVLRLPIHIGSHFQHQLCPGLRRPRPYSEPYQFSIRIRFNRTRPRPSGTLQGLTLSLAHVRTGSPVNPGLTHVGVSAGAFHDLTPALTHFCRSTAFRASLLRWRVSTKSGGRLFMASPFISLPQRARAALRALSMRSAELNFWLPTPPLRPSFYGCWLLLRHVHDLRTAGRRSAMHHLCVKLCKKDA